tara:strand:+ start:419 stop:1651 length:1233 start_codon:yes stop_codon:yes gene_type:complete
MLIAKDGSSLDFDTDLLGGNPIVDYFESVMSPSISMTITIIDVDQLISRKGITGGESLDLTVRVNGFADFKITSKKHKLILNSVRDVVTETNKQVATLEFVSEESLVNETKRLNKKFTGNVTQIVKDILEEDKRGILTKKEFKSDDAVNKYSFVGNLKRPFDTIQWLCPKAQSSNQNFGFLFYETLDGYNFRSIEKLLKEKATVYNRTDRVTEEVNRILQSSLNESNDIGMNLRMGMYSNKTIFIDLENETFKEETFKIDELKPPLKKPPTLPEKLHEKETRLMFRILDQGALQKGSTKKDVEKRNELAVYQNKSYIRNNLLFSQSLSVSIPINPDLKAGQMIEIRLPLKKGNSAGAQGQENVSPTSDFGNEKENDLSGKYLISELRHLIGGRSAETQLELVRDVFTSTA